MARKRPKVNLSQPVQPRTGDLEKLFATEQDAESSAGLQLVALRIDAVQPDPDQPRRSFPQDGLQELADSIQQDGVIQPIEVTEIRAGQYMIVHGERRWRAARIAGMSTIPAVVRRRDYDVVTRFVRQIVENIQREDLNDVDRAAGLIRLRDLMQEELDAALAEEVPSDEPWGTRITWSKVGKRLGMSRQRIHQLIQLLNLPDEIKDAVRDGELSERDTRIYQGLSGSQQRALHRARMAGDITAAEARKLARFLKDTPDLTVHKAMRLLQQPQQNTEPLFDSSEADPYTAENAAAGGHAGDFDPDTADFSALPVLDEEHGGVSGRSGPATAVDRLIWVRHHLNRVNLQRLTPQERREVARMLQLIQQDIASLLQLLDG